MQGLFRVVFCLVVALVLGTMGSTARADLLRIEQALLISSAGERAVTLPHTLAPSDFEPGGSSVIYRLTFDMPATAEGLQAIYISKLSLSGRLSSGGQAIWACGAGDMAELRCLHRAHLIQLPAGFLAPGRVELDLEIFANSRQTNGLSPVIIGPHDQLFHQHYRLMRFLKLDLLQMLAVFAGVAGLLSLAAGFAAPRERIFFVFAVAAILEAVASFLMSAVDPLGDRQTASWLIFNSRYIGVLLKVLLLYQVFGRLTLRDPVVVCFLALMALAPVALGVTGSDLRVVLVLYSCVGLGMAVTMIRMVRWTYGAPSRWNMAWTAVAFVLFASSLHDYLRLGGAATFDGVYLLYYVFPLSMIVMGAMLFAQMGKGLRVAQNFNLALSQEVGERTAELESALASIRSMEASALSLTRNIPIGTFILQTWGHERARYAFFSDRLRQIYNLPPGSELPTFDEIAAFLHPDDDLRCRAILRKSIEETTQFEFEFRILGPEGVWRWLRCIMLPQPGSAAPVVWDGVVIDVTEARAAEERLRSANAGLVEAAADQSRMAERERLLQEMHDGFGSQLSSARLAIEQGDLAPPEVAQILQECSEDLRLMVDTLGNIDGDLNNAIADFRYRTQRRLFGTGITITWDIAIADDARLPPTQILHILRVLQEAKNNALRHSGARHLQVSVQLADGHLSASVADDGRGLEGAPREGRGLANMRKRCREIGAQLQIKDTGQGTMVRLTMDLPDAE